MATLAAAHPTERVATAATGCHNPPITGLSWAALREVLAARGERPFRTEQVARWVYRSAITDFAPMLNVPQALRAWLAETYAFSSAEVVTQVASADGDTTKAVLRLSDGSLIETVLMQYHRRSDGTGADRSTVCVSTQVGCALQCSFCATGLMGLTRNLTAAEIIDQALHFLRRTRQRPPVVRNVVFMGMGEPLLNYAACLEAVARLCDPLGAGLGPPRLTISTSGWLPGIERLADEPWPVRLAVSLHAPTNDVRDELVPLNRRYPVEDLLAACRAYQARTGRRVTFEYTMLAGVNDSPALARALVKLVHGLDCHINLIPMNPVAELPYAPSPDEAVQTFHQTLRQAGLIATIRREMGRDIQAACGQLQTAVRRQPLVQEHSP